MTNFSIFALQAAHAFGKEAAQLTGKNAPQAGLAAEIWATADAMVQAGEAISAAAVLAKLNPALHKPSNVSVEVSVWRKFHGIAA